MNKTTKSINLDELKGLVIPEKVCRNCEWWEIYSDDWGICKQLPLCYWFSAKAEVTEEYGPYGTEFIEHPVEIQTDGRFCCNQWQKRDDNQNH